MNIPRTVDSLVAITASRVKLEVDAIVLFLRAPNEDGTPCSADREVLAARVERLEHWK